MRSYKRELTDSLEVCTHCGYHFRYTADCRLKNLFDGGKYKKLDEEVTSTDPLKFTDSKPYKDRIVQAKEVSGLPEAIISGKGKVAGHVVYAGAMDMSFIGGSMGSAVGEKITRLIERAVAERGAVIIYSASGGARMQEGTLFANANGQDLRRSRSVARCSPPFHIGSYGSYNRRRHSQFCNAWRRHSRRAESSDRFCGSACYRANNKAEITQRLSAQRIFVGPRDGRYGR